ncbi:RNA polymerase sigma-70 factor, ECF subfamily [Chitinophaga sp. CF118]|uniref:RNA polymerase sigma factor n=1 Tax=Chitinophaga sp. CF118 TaxID=1884367 RepID=UPI0008E597A6|nr:sigma-70 family RNA polymerase sigma factor [Chitinophaga sp. CF118]SFF10106.1 RNA polymerase sigma-70 factor, ECF subfamily [Chitinophaga sp. CF118]
MDLLSEQELLLRIAEGDEHAFRELYFRYDTMLFTFLLKLTRSDIIAEELLQETFLQLWLHRDSLADINYPRAYIHRIAANLSHRWLKQHLLHRKVLAERELQQDLVINDIEDSLAWKDISILIVRIIEKMPEQRRKIYQLHRDSGLSSGEIATIMGVSSSTVRNTIVVAVRNIREQLLEAGYTLLLISFFIR